MGSNHMNQQFRETKSTKKDKQSDTNILNEFLLKLAYSNVGYRRKIVVMKKFLENIVKKED